LAAEGNRLGGIVWSVHPGTLFMIPRTIFFLVLAVAASARAQGIYTGADELRTGGGGCPKSSLGPFQHRPELEQAAAGLSRGQTLKQAMSATRYRAAQVRSIGLRGDVADPFRAMAQKGYCPQFQDPALKEIGIYRDAHQAWVILAAPFDPAVPMSQAAAGERVLRLVNEARSASRRCGDRVLPAAPRLGWSNELAAAARAHAEDMAAHDFFSHDGHDGSDPGERVARAGYRYRMTGENIAAGQTDPDKAVAGWLQSPEHCANLMRSGFRDMGVAYAVNRASKLGVYWVQEFGLAQ